MILTQAIREIYPSVDFEVDVVVRDDGDGVVYIAYWGLPDPQPSEAELTLAWLSVLSKKAIEEENQVAIEQAAKAAKDLHELLEGGDWTLGEVKQILKGVLDRLDFLDFLLTR